MARPLRLRPLMPSELESDLARPAGLCGPAPFDWALVPAPSGPSSADWDAVVLGHAGSRASGTRTTSVMCKICKADVTASPRNGVAVWNELLRLERLASLEAPVARNVFPAVCEDSPHLALVMAPTLVTLEDAFLRGALNSAPVSAVLGVILRLLRLVTDLHERGVTHCSIRPDKVALARNAFGGLRLVLADAASCRFASEPATLSDVRGEFAPPHWRQGVPAQAVASWCASWSEEYGRPLARLPSVATGPHAAACAASGAASHRRDASSSSSSAAAGPSFPPGPADAWTAVGTAEAGVEVGLPDSGRSSRATVDSDAHDRAVFGADDLDGPAPCAAPAGPAADLVGWALCGRPRRGATLPPDSALDAVRRVAAMAPGPDAGVTPEHAARAVVDDAAMAVMCLRLLPARLRRTEGSGGVMVENLEPSPTTGYSLTPYQAKLASVWRERADGADPALRCAVAQLPALLHVLASEDSHITAKTAVRHLETMLGREVERCLAEADRALAAADPLLRPPPLASLAPGEGPTAVLPSLGSPLVFPPLRPSGAPHERVATARATTQSTPTAGEGSARASSGRFTTERSQASMAGSARAEATASASAGAAAADSGRACDWAAAGAWPGVR